MIANLKKSFKLLKYAYHLKNNIILMAVLMAVVIIIDILTYRFGYNLLLIGSVISLLAFVVPLQLKEDLMLSQMLVSSGFRRFFDVNFADALLLLGSLSSFWMNAVIMLLFYEDGSIEGNTKVGLLLTMGCAVGILTMFHSVLMKHMIISFFMYFVVGVGLGVAMAVIEELGERGLLPGIVPTFVISTCVVLLGNLVAMALRRAMYKKPLSRFASSEGLKKAMV